MSRFKVYWVSFPTIIKQASNWIHGVFWIVYVLAQVKVFTGKGAKML